MTEFHDWDDIRAELDDGNSAAPANAKRLAESIEQWRTGTTTERDLDLDQ